MATVTFTGRANRTAYAGFTFYRGEPRPLPDEVAAALAGHPWFTVKMDTQAPVEAAPKRRARKRADENPA